MGNSEFNSISFNTLKQKLPYTLSHHRIFEWFCGAFNKKKQKQTKQLKMALNPKTKKYIIAGALGILSIAAAAAYLQYKKLMDYVLGFKSVKVKKITKDVIDLDVFLNFQNKSNIEFNIKSQKYDVYVNDIFITKLENSSPTIIKANTTSVLPLNVILKPSEIASKIGGAKGILAMANPNTLKIKIDMKLQVQLWFLTINIPYVYQDTLKNMMAPTEQK